MERRTDGGKEVRNKGWMMEGGKKEVRMDRCRKHQVRELIDERKRKKMEVERNGKKWKG